MRNVIAFAATISFTGLLFITGCETNTSTIGFGTSRAQASKTIRPVPSSASSSSPAGSKSSTSSSSSSSVSSSSSSVGGSGKTITVSWNANHEKLVNQPGGGYRVFYSTSPQVSPAGDPFVNVPCVSGMTAPTSTVISVPSSGTYYVYVAGYSQYQQGLVSASVKVVVP